jgi:hypothetical protein
MYNCFVPLRGGGSLPTSALKASFSSTKTPPLFSSIEDHRGQLKRDIKENELPCKSTLWSQLGELKGLVYAQKHKGEGEGQDEHVVYEATSRAAEDEANEARPPPPAPRNPSDMSEIDSRAYLLEFGEEIIKKDVDRHVSSDNPKDRLKCCIGGVITDVLRGILRDGTRPEADISNRVSMFHVHQVGAGSQQVWK